MWFTNMYSFMRFQIWNMKHLFYRFAVVCNSSALIGRERRLGSLILKMSMCTSVGIGILSLIHKDHVFNYLFCMGTLENFYFNIEHPFSSPVGGAGIKLSFFNKYRLSTNLASFAFIFVVPTLYFKIFQFRKKQDTSISGIRNLYNPYSKRASSKSDISKYEILIFIHIIYCVSYLIMCFGF